MSIQVWKQEFSKKFLSVIKHKNRYEVFRDWAYLAAIACEQMPVHLGILPKSDSYERLESQYLEKAKNYDSNTLTVFSEMLGIVSLALAEHKTDFLGEIYSELEISLQKDAGQFFTPYSVGKMSVQTTITEGFLRDTIQKNGRITVGEPAVGAGCLLIAVVEVMSELGYDPSSQMYFEGVDIDPLCCDMAYIQMSVMNIPGFVIHGNSLSNEHWKVRATPKLQLFQKYEQISPSYIIAQMLMQIEQEVSRDSAEVVEPVKEEGKPDIRQLNLFEDL